ncbi:unnamed protein product, partial [marine sediment metagenome]
MYEEVDVLEQLQTIGVLNLGNGDHVERALISAVRWNHPGTVRWILRVSKVSIPSNILEECCIEAVEHSDLDVLKTLYQESEIPVSVVDATVKAILCQSI